MRENKKVYSFRLTEHEKNIIDSVPGKYIRRFYWEVNSTDKLVYILKQYEKSFKGEKKNDEY